MDNENDNGIEFVDVKSENNSQKDDLFDKLEPEDNQEEQISQGH